ncbi:MAG: hypothetical protein KA498_03690 [Neisseriaceae bacterium]|nr:hypothetical protein [Neisseriaceae bacterium]
MAVAVWRQPVGMALLPAASKRHGVSLGLVMACYAVAKLFELGDHQVYALTQGWVVWTHAQACVFRRSRLASALGPEKRRLAGS